MPYPSAEGMIVNRISIGVVSVAGLSGGHHGDMYTVISGQTCKFSH